MQINTRLRQCLSWTLPISVLLAPFSTPLKVSAQSVSRPGSASGIPRPTASPGSLSSSSNLDLTSANANLTAGNKSAVNLMVGGQLMNGTISGGTPISILPGQSVTPAQYLAVLGAMQGNQTLLLGSSGTALAGSFNLNSNHVQDLGGLTVPSGVSANAIGFNQATPLNVAGNVNVLGSLYALQTAPNVTAVLNMANLTVGSAGLISGSLPAGSILPGVYSSSGMQLNVAGNVLNQGSILSAGTLSVLAGGNIVNQTVNNSQAILSAQNVNLISGTGSIINSGLIQASNTLNLNAQNPQTNLIVNNTGGLLRALGELNPLSGVLESGVINFREDGPNLELANVTVYGGSLEANNGINLYGKNINVHVNEIRGAVSSKGSVAHITVEGGNLELGKQLLTGDPTYYNTAGDVLIQDLTSVPGDIAVIADGAIITLGDITISTASSKDFSIFLSAGYKFTVAPLDQGQVFYAPNDPGDTTNTITFTGGTNPGKSVNTLGTKLNLATAGTGRIMAIATGTIDLGGGAVSTDDGAVTIYASEIKGTGSISTGKGDIELATGIADVSITSVKDGTVTNYPSLQGASGDITAPQITSTSGLVTLAAGTSISLGGDISAGAIDIGPVSGSKGVSITGNTRTLTAATQVVVNPGTEDIISLGSVSAGTQISIGSVLSKAVQISGASLKAAGSNIAIVAFGAISSSNLTTITAFNNISIQGAAVGAGSQDFGDITAGGAGFNPSISIVADKGAISVGKLSINDLSGSISVKNNDSSKSSTTTGDIITANAGDASTITFLTEGSMQTGKIDTSSSAGNAGALDLKSNSGGISVLGQILTTAAASKNSGTVQISAANDIKVQGNIDTSGDNSGNIVIGSSKGGIEIDGNIKNTATATQGDVTLDSQNASLSINGGVATANSIMGSIDSSGRVAIRASSVLLNGVSDAISAGVISIQASTGDIAAGTPGEGGLNAQFIVMSAATDIGKGSGLVTISTPVPGFIAASVSAVGGEFNVFAKSDLTVDHIVEQFNDVTGISTKGPILLITQNLTVESGSQISTLDSSIVLQTDSFTFNNATSIDPGSKGTATLMPATLTDITVGGSTTGVYLNDLELGKINAQNLVLGDSFSYKGIIRLGGDLNLVGKSAGSAPGAYNIEFGSAQFSADGFNINSGGNNVLIEATGSSTSITTSKIDAAGGNIVFKASDGITIAGDILTTGTGGIDIRSSVGAIDAGTKSITGGSSPIVIDGLTDAITLGSVSGSGSISIGNATASKSILISGNVSNTSGSGNISIISKLGSINGALSVSSSKDLFIQSVDESIGDSTALGSLSAGGNLQLQAQKEIKTGTILGNGSKITVQNFDTSSIIEIGGIKAGGITAGGNPAGAVAITGALSVVIFGGIKTDASATGNGGDISVNAEFVTIAGDVSAKGIGSTSSGGTININAATSSLQIEGSIDNTSTGTGTAGKLILSSAGASSLDINSPMPGANAINGVLKSSGDISVSALSLTLTGATTVMSGKTILLTTTAGGIDSNSGEGIISSDDITVSSTGSITLTTVDKGKMNIGADYAQISNTGDLLLTLSPVGTQAGVYVQNTAGNFTLASDFKGSYFAVSLEPGKSINLENHSLDLSGAADFLADDMIFTGTIKASTSVSFQPASSSFPIILGGTQANALSLTPVMLGQISAKTLIVGSSSNNGGIIVPSNLNLGYSLIMNSSEVPFDSSGKTIVLAGDTFRYQSFNGGSIKVGLITLTGSGSGEGSFFLQTFNGKGASDITLDKSGLPAAAQYALQTNTGDIINLPASINPLRFSNGNGGDVFLRGLLANTSLSVDASGSTGKDGGTIIFERTAKTPFAPNSGGSSPTLNFNVDGESAGSINISTNSNFTFTPSGSISLKSSGNGNGASLTLQAGIVFGVNPAAGGTLLVNGSLNLDGSGNGDGGSLTLRSNSATTFNLGGTGPNSMKGTISVAKGSGGGGTNGTFEIENRAGGINSSIPVTAVDSIDFRAAGTVTVSKSLGDSTTSDLFLSGDKGIKVSGTGTVLEASSVSLVSGEGAGGPISANTKTSELRSNTTSTVSITNLGSSDLTIRSSSGSAFSVSSLGLINTQNTIEASKSIMLKSGSGSNININSNLETGAAGTITLNSGNSVFMPSGDDNYMQAKVINITTGSNGNIGKGTDPNDAVRVQATTLSTNADAVINIKNVFAVSKVPLTSFTLASAKAKQTLTITSESAVVITPSLPDLSEAIIDTTAGSGGITIAGSLGNVNTTKSITLNSSGKITGGGILSTSATAPATVSLFTNDGDFGTSSAPLKVNSPNLSISATTGLININSLRTAAVAVLENSTQSLVANKSVTFVSASTDTTFKGSISGTTVSLKTAGLTTFNDSIVSLTGAITFTQTASKATVSMDPAKSIISKTTLTLTALGAVSLGGLQAGTVPGDGFIKIKTGGGNSLVGDIQGTGNVSFTQGATGGSQFGEIASGSNITLTLTPSAGQDVLLTGNIGANNNVVITQSGKTGGDTTVSAGKSISAGAGVSITAVGKGTFFDINSGATFGGAITVSTKGASSYGSLNASGPSKGAITLTQAGAGQFFVLDATAATTFKVTSSSSDLYIIGGVGSGNITAGGNIEIKYTGKDAAAGIILGNDVSSKTGSVILTTTGNIDQPVFPSVISAGKITFNSSTGNLQNGGGTLPIRVTSPQSSLTFAANTKGTIWIQNDSAAVPLTLSVANATGNSVKLFSGAGVIVTPTLSGASSIDIDTSAGTGGIKLNGATLGGTSTKTVTLKTASGDVNGKAAITTSSGGGVSFIGSTGKFGGTSALLLNTPNLLVNAPSSLINVSNISKALQTIQAVTTSNSFTYSAAGPTQFDNVSASSISLTTTGTATFNGDINASTGAFVLNQKGTSGATNFNLGTNKTIDAGTFITLTTLGSTTLANTTKMTAKNGGITVTETAGFLSIGAGAQLSSNGPSAKITLMEKANAATAGITIGDNALLSTLTGVSKPGTKLPLPGQISVIIGSSIPATPVLGKAPPNINPVTVNPGPNSNFYYGANSGNIDTSAGAGVGNEIDLTITGNTAIVFSAGTTSKISLGKSSAISADPPPSIVPVVISANTRNNSVPSSTNLLRSNHQIDANQINGLNFRAAGVSAQGFSDTFAEQLNFGSNLARNDVAVSSTTTSPRTASANLNRFLQGNVVETSERNDSFSSPSEQLLFRFNSGVPSHEKCSKSAFATNGERTLVSITSENQVLVPAKDITVQTPFCSIEIDARSIVLLVSNAEGTAIYNIDDHHRDAVRVIASGKKVLLAPGRHLMISNKSARSFDTINPIEPIAYRNLFEFELNNLKLFKSEFSIPSAIACIPQLKQICLSKDPQCLKLMTHVLKTAVAMQLRNGDRYQQILRPRVAAFKP